MSEVVAQMYLGTAAWIDKVQKILDGEERSEEHARAQVNPGRPKMDDVVESVAKTFDTTAEGIAQGRGTLERKLVAYIAFEDGLVPLRTLAKRLGVTSAGGISSLVARCRRDLPKDAELRELLETCRKRMRRRPPPSRSRASIRPSPPAAIIDHRRARDGDGGALPQHAIG